MTSALVGSQLTMVRRDGDRDLTVLAGLDLTIEHGELVVVLGPSGSGKSTLLSLLAGFTVPTSGMVTVLGQSFAGKDDEARARVRRSSLSFLFQRFHLFDALSARENVVEVLCILGIARPEAEARADETLSQLGMKSLLHRAPAALSGGEKQRVALARALSSDAKLLLCDEPTSALDGATALQVMALLRSACAAGKTVLVVTHDERFASEASRVFDLRDGRLELREVAGSRSPS